MGRLHCAWSDFVFFCLMKSAALLKMIRCALRYEGNLRYGKGTWEVDSDKCETMRCLGNGVSSLLMRLMIALALLSRFYHSSFAFACLSRLSAYPGRL